MSSSLPSWTVFFRSAKDALDMATDFARRGIALWLLDLGGAVTGNGLSRLFFTMVAAFAEFERDRISERIKDAKRNLRSGNRHQGGSRPFGYRFGATNGPGKARELIPDPEERAAIADIVALRQGGKSLMAIRNELRGRGFAISHHRTQRRNDSSGRAGIYCCSISSIAPSRCGSKDLPKSGGG
jgi:DNA invertase Pin-like site-specific DNA recombinase